MTLFESKTFLMGRLQGAKSERATVRRSFASSADVLLQTPVAFKPFVVHGEIWSLTIMDVSPGQLVSGLKFKMPRKRTKVTSKGVFLRTYFFLRDSIAFETLRKAVQRARVVMAERFLLSADARAGMRIACAFLVSRMTDSVVRKTTAAIDPHNANSAQVLPLCHIFSTTAFHKAGVCVGGCAKCSRFAQLAQRLSAPQALQLA